MRLCDIHAILQQIAPERLAEPWDKVGLQVGDPAQEVSRVLVCIDLTRAVLAEAIRYRASLIVAYHPPIFHPIHAIATGADADRVSHTITQAIRRGMAVYSPHTALDSAVGGLNDWLALRIAGKGAVVRPITPAAEAGQAGASFKIITFVPLAQADAVRAAMAGACAGRIGNYTECSFNVRGEGTFRPGRGARPFVGARGRLERVAEVRTEMLCRASDLAAVIAAMRKAHPYEEPAFDIIRVESAPPHPGTPTPGAGRIATPAQPVGLGSLVQSVKRVLNLRQLSVAVPRGSAPNRPVRSIAIAAGAGGSVLKKACDADAWITGELPHHDVLAAIDAGRVVITAGHSETERPYLRKYARRLQQATGATVRWHVSRADRAPAALR